MMKIAVLGGSFNPVHKGHLLLADSVCTLLGYDKLLFIPVSAPPHKIIKNAASSFDRLKMLQLACEDDFRFAVDSCEIDRGGISYTWDTVCFLEHKYAEQLSAKIGLIVGQDLAAEFSKWKNAALLAEKTDLILAHRPFEKPCSAEGNKPDSNFKGLFATEKMLSEFPYPHLVLNNAMIAVSSTEIREKIRKGEDLTGLVPEKVYCYIRERKLYGYK